MKEQIDENIPMPIYSEISIFANFKTISSTRCYSYHDDENEYSILNIVFRTCIFEFLRKFFKGEYGVRRLVVFCLGSVTVSLRYNLPTGRIDSEPENFLPVSKLKLYSKK